MNIDEVYDAMDTRNNNIKKILDVMNQVSELLQSSDSVGNNVDDDNVDDNNQSEDECIDLSSCSYISGFDINNDFPKIKTNSPAVVIRAGYGNHISQKDGKFDENYNNAKANGLKVGAYWYSYAHTAEEAIQEVRAFIYVIADKQFDMPIVFDIEQNFLLNNTSVITMRTEIITLVRSYCKLYGYNVQFITLNEDGKIVSIDNDTN